MAAHAALFAFALLLVYEPRLAVAAVAVGVADTDITDVAGTRPRSHERTLSMPAALLRAETSASADVDKSRRQEPLAKPSSRPEWMGDAEVLLPTPPPTDPHDGGFDPADPKYQICDLKDEYRRRRACDPRRRRETCNRRREDVVNAGTRRRSECMFEKDN
eukprot:TRINITY_DN39757_c0_g1_i1.p1 TRINITY_DN39757_c0_g1~~TRINITY_DN39757_c0_g1_i1.p1  ORF type:complete len:161 (+),score=27.17 TRINITY_DN39757_c0_g1_i1:71-553(+)